MPTTQDSPKLSELICFDLYAASHAINALYRTLFAELDLTYPQYLVLVVLWRERTSTVKALIDALHLDYGTLTPLLKRLESKDLVTRERRRDDERSVTIGLTRAGATMQDRTRHIPACINAATGLDRQETRDLHTTLRTLITAVNAYDNRH